MQSVDAITYFNARRIMNHWVISSRSITNRPTTASCCSGDQMPSQLVFTSITVSLIVMFIAFSRWWRWYGTALRKSSGSVIENTNADSGMNKTRWRQFYEHRSSPRPPTNDVIRSVHIHWMNSWLTIRPLNTWLNNVVFFDNSDLSVIYKKEATYRAFERNQTEAGITANPKTAPPNQVLLFATSGFDTVVYDHPAWTPASCQSDADPACLVEPERQLITPTPSSVLILLISELRIELTPAGNNYIAIKKHYWLVARLSAAQSKSMMALWNRPQRRLIRSREKILKSHR